MDHKILNWISSKHVNLSNMKKPRSSFRSKTIAKSIWPISPSLVTIFCSHDMANWIYKKWGICLNFSIYHITYNPLATENILVIDFPKDTINFKSVFILNPHLLTRTEIKVIEVNPMFFRFLKCTKSFNAENPKEKWKVQDEKKENENWYNFSH